MEFLLSFMNEYGYLVLFLSLALGIIVLPIPMEALMGYAGFLSFQGQLNWIGCVIAATLGCVIGMIVSYYIGAKLGMPFFEKYGSQLRFRPEKIHSTSVWFNKYGNKLLIIVFFIPVLRHITGYFLGITRLPLKVFSIYSFLGSFLWVSSFIFLGKMLGPNWELLFHGIIKKYIMVICIILGILLLGVLLFKKYKKGILKQEQTR
ncbi:DedA family protein [Paenibacillus sp. BSR1-1]|uniref:DedA family protein n=1 Tax=Paenibacillus sp. BSR1-1 TaxID=3020845 RepID=UPI0025B22C15|nr:DedA family protein [Paenibacillus sp. BSR1-1]MDN3015208.1 DedA family protein [Paenibacillus sp. BSR1-1]